MPKFTIELDSETHRILKENARKDERSLTQYMQRILRQSAGTLKVDTINPQLTASSNTMTQQSNQNNSTITNNNSTINNYTNPQPQQKQTPRKNVIIGAEFDEDFNFDKEGKLTWRR